ncbi:MAG: hypothetical protein RIR22_2312, partial [Planctomycetota bacterium]
AQLEFARVKTAIILINKGKVIEP